MLGASRLYGMPDVHNLPDIYYWHYRRVASVLAYLRAHDQFVNARRLLG